MRKIRRIQAILLGLSGALMLIFASSCTRKTAALTVAEIKVYPAQTAGEISPLIYGASVEWTENGNRIFDPDRGQLRPEVVNLLKPLHIPVWRFPGGILSDYYHWRDGIGQRGQRPKRSNPMDQSTHENSFGTDEFVEFCKALGSEPIITANFGTGSLQETLEWQKYFSEKGLPVKFWEIGNEIYLAEPKEHASVPGNDRRIYKTVQQYSSGFREWSEALRAADRQAQVGAIAGTYNTSPQNANWLNPLLSGAGSDIDFIALHNAFAPLIFGRYDYTNQKKRDEAYQAMFAQAMFSAEDTRRVEQAAAQVRWPAPKIAITEHFPLFGGSPDQLMAILDQSRTLASALYTSSLFHAFMREHVWMANYNIAVSKWFGALLTDTDSGIIKTPTYHLFDLYRNHFGNTLINVLASSPVFSTKQVGTVKSRDDVPYLDAVASTRQGSVYLAVINRNLSQQLQARITVDGLPGDAIAELTTLAGPGPNAINGASLSPSTQGGSADSITLQHGFWKGVNAGVYTFPPASVTVFKWEAAQRPRKK
jgi:alpha-N-arabinofuranosidase